ncbi:hypothetical protein PMIN03_011830 [Paraphaeosphaeria minitans]
MVSVAWAAPRMATRLSSPNRASSQDIELFQPTLRISRDEHEQSPLRILPLGASITYGQGSINGNGYRKYLEQMLQHAGLVVDMVGTVSAGKMKDNQNEGHRGALVHQVAMYAEQDLHFQPNLVLINAGTNDVLRDSPQYPLHSIDQRMDKLLDRLFEHIHCVTIVLSTLLPNANFTADNDIRTIVNPKYRAIVEGRRRKGQRIILADMYPNVAKGSLSPDGTHPTDIGYEDMASVWYKAVDEAIEEDMLQR